MAAGDYLRFLLALLLVAGLILALGWLARRLRLGRGTAGGGRLEVVEMRPIDPRNRLVLVRRDQVEHLLLVGHDGGVVVEADIDRPRQRRPGLVAGGEAS
jgi:flagellar protein FliO/FliZ